MRVARAVLLFAVSVLGLGSLAPAGYGAGPRSTPEGIVFTFEAPGAGQVYIAGEFNNWVPTGAAMSQVEEGLWQITLPLRPGAYQYKFVIDGSTWQEDPESPGYVPDPYGGRNSIVTILEDGTIEGASGAPEKKVEPVVGKLQGLAKPLHLAILWHQHQPRYFKDPETGEYQEPWVRIHGIKDYYDMIAILADYPEMKFTVNLTPVLLSQHLEVTAGIEAYMASGGRGPVAGGDKWVRLTLTPPVELTDDEKAFILRNFFRMPRETMLDIYPRFKELAAKKRGDSVEDIAASIPDYTDRDWRDLQAWFNLSEFDPDFKEGEVTLPDGEKVTVKHLIAKGGDFTEADKREIIEAQLKILRNIVPVHRQYQDRGQVEVITCPFYHPILPLLCDTDVAKEASPGIELPERHFAYPEDAAAQIGMARDFHEDLFGASPKGMWPAEGAVSEAILPLVADTGIRWIAGDEEVLAQSLGLTNLSIDRKYRMYWAEKGQARVAMIFRDHRLSDDIGFRYSRMNGTEAANDMIKKLYGIHKAIQGLDGDYGVPIIMDGENAWEHFERDGKEFFQSFYSQASEAGWLVPVTVSEYLEKSPPTETLPRLAPGSWIAHNFDTWIGEEEENKAWDYLAEAREMIKRRRPPVATDAYRQAMTELYIAEGSDWFWWYGLDQGSGIDESFDAAFRGTLKRIYTLMDEEPPQYLELPIVEVAGAEPSRAIRGRLDIVPDGGLSRPDEWDPAGFIDDIDGGAMQQAGGDMLTGLYYGFDDENLVLRIDTGPEVRDLPGDHCYDEIYLSGAGSMPANAYSREGGEGDSRVFGFGIARRLRFDYSGKMTVVSLYDADGAGGWTNLRTLPALCYEFVEMKIPLEQLGLRTGDDLKMVVVGYCDHKVKDTVPNSGPVSIRVPPMGDQGPLKSLTDPVGDDHGPGTYIYPTDPVFVPGAFDLTSLEIMLDGEENVIFKLGVGGGLDPVWGGVAGYSLQAIDIYIDTDGVAGSGQRDLFRARKARTVADHAWEYFVRACMDTIAIYDTKGMRLEQSGVKSYADKASSSLFVTFPRATVPEGEKWNVIVAMLGHDGYSDGQIRPVLGAAEQWYFGGCDNEALCPAIMDLIVEDGPSQEEQLSAYGRIGDLVELRGVNIEFP
jgi:alpha-amylase/alpha-mannosidase (GH57 family)